MPSLFLGHFSGRHFPQFSSQLSTITDTWLWKHSGHDAEAKSAELWIFSMRFSVMVRLFNGTHTKFQDYAVISNWNSSEGTVEMIFEVTLLLSILNPQCFKILISPHSLKGYCFHYIFIKAILVYIALWFSGKFPWRLMVLSIFIPGIRNSLNNYLIRYFIDFKIFVFKKIISFIFETII